MATHTVKQSGGDFTALASALADGGTGSGDTISIEGSWTVNDTAAATVSDANITIETDADSYVDPTNLLSPSHYRLRHSGGSHCITVSSGGCTIDGLESQQATTTGGSDEVIRINNTGTTTIENCVIWAAQQYSDQDGIYRDSTATVNIENCIIFNFGRCGIDLQNYDSSATITFNVNSCTVYDCGTDGDSASGGIVLFADASSSSVLTINVFNTVVLNCSNSAAEDYHETGTQGTRTWDIHNSIDSDNSIASRDGSAVGCLASRTATDSGSPGAGNWVMLNDITGSIPWDLTLQDDGTNNDAQEMHTSGSGAGMSMPSTDIQGDTRSSSYDCGADHIIAAGVAASMPPSMAHRKLIHLLVR